MPSGTPMTMASPNPIRTRRRVATMLWISARSFSRLGKLRTTSAGLGRITGEIRRLSAVAPRVASHQSSTTAAMPPTPTSRRITGGGASRSARGDGLDSGGIYFGADASAG